MNKFLKLKKITKYKKRLHTTICDNARNEWFDIVGKWLPDDDDDDEFDCVCGFPEFDMTLEEYSRPAVGDTIADGPYTVVKRLVSERYVEPKKHDPVD